MINSKYLFFFFFFLARDFVCTLLNPNPSERPTAEKALEHEWLTSGCAPNIELSDDILQIFNARKTFRKAVVAIQAINKFQNGIKNSQEYDDSDDDDDDDSDEDDGNDNNDYNRRIHRSNQ